LIVAALAATACGDTQAPGGASGPATGAAEPPAPDTSIALTTRVSPDAARPAATSRGFEARTGELLNPDAAAMVFLYYDLARMPPPIDRWVEEDGRVKWAPGPDKAAQRTATRAELESAAAAVRDIGSIRLTMHANLSEYDPTYGEFSVRALAPSSVVSFDALGQKVSLKFGNGRNAQIWRVPQAEAQAIRDRIGYAGNVSLDALLRITDVQPGPGGGTIVTDVVEYEMQTAPSGLVVARVRVAAP
jgi:hypothetical protein